MTLSNRFTDNKKIENYYFFKKRDGFLFGFSSMHMTHLECENNALIIYSSSHKISVKGSGLMNVIIQISGGNGFVLEESKKLENSGKNEEELLVESIDIEEKTLDDFE